MVHLKLHHKIYKTTCPQLTKFTSEQKNPRTFFDHHISLLFKHGKTASQHQEHIQSQVQVHADGFLSYTGILFFTMLMYCECHDMCEHLQKGSNGRSKALEAFSQRLEETVHFRNQKT